MENQVLSIEQMQELQELGIDTSNASMCWSRFKNDPDFSIQAMSKDMFEEQIKNWDTIYTIYDYTIIPTFTLQDILEILPKEIIKNRVHYIKCLDAYYDERYLFLYINREIHDILHEECDIPLKASFKMLKWCKQNSYI